MAFYKACRFFVVCSFLKLLTIFVGRRRNFSLFLLVVFLLFLSAVSEASCYFVGCLFAVVLGRLGAFRRPSWKLFVVFVGRLGSFSLFLPAVSEASSCFRWPSWKLQFAVLAVL